MAGLLAGGGELHQWRISEREYERHQARRGRRFAYEHIDARRTALVVIDMVPFFVDESAYVRGIVGNINSVADALREVSGTVVWVVPRHACPSPWEVGFFGTSVASDYARSGGAARVQERVAPQMATSELDLWVEKTGPSAFFPGRSKLDSLLQSRAIDTVIIAGTVTSVCCESSARDAATLGYRVVFVADANADVSDDAHNATLRTIYRSFGDVRPTCEVLPLLD